MTRPTAGPFDHAGEQTERQHDEQGSARPSATIKRGSRYVDGWRLRPTSEAAEANNPPAQRAGCHTQRRAQHDQHIRAVAAPSPAARASDQRPRNPVSGGIPASEKSAHDQRRGRPRVEPAHPGQLFELATTELLARQRQPQRQNPPG